jgi:chaperone required for assembly of F1-ATPase
MTARPKRFYQAASVDGAGPAFRVLLDGRPVRTPAKRELAVPARALAEALAAEWDAQGERIEPASMPLTRLVNSAIDGVAGREAEVRADIARYAGSDLLCYRAEGPAELVHRQTEAWDPVLAWARETLGARFVLGQGIVPVAQPQTATAAIEGALAGLDAFALAAHHTIVTLTASALLALALARGRLTADETWAAAHVDEDWQIGQWGEDTEAKARRERRWAEMRAASRLLALLAPTTARA